MIYRRRYHFFSATFLILATAGLLAGPENPVLRAVLVYGALACVPFALVNSWKSAPARIAAAAARAEARTASAE